MKILKKMSLVLVVCSALAPQAAQAEGGALSSPSYVGDTVEYKAAFEDTFVHLARDYNLGFTELRAANPGVDPWIPGEDTELILPTRHLFPDAPKEGIIINLPEMRLYAFLEGEEPISYPLGVGREGLETPTGTTKIIRKMDGPSWFPTERMRKEDPDLPRVVKPGPENPLGTHALYFDWPQYAIHGTNRPFGIGRRISSGCIRMYPEDIAEFYARVPVHTKVTVVDQPLKAAWIENEFYLEANPTLAQSMEMEEKGYIDDVSISAAQIDYILAQAGDDYEGIDWSAAGEALIQLRGYPVKIGSREDVSPDSEPTEAEAEDLQIRFEKARQDAFDALGVEMLDIVEEPVEDRSAEDKEENAEETAE